MSEGRERLGEFELIEQLLAPLSAARDGAFELTNDAATISVPEGHELVLTKDMLVAGVHFFADDPPDLIARKLLRVNLSDLAAMGAAPHSYLLGLALTKDIDDAWLRQFAAGLAEDQETFGTSLIGGDTVSTPGPLTLSVTALGTVAAGQSIERSGAEPGDILFVTGTIGDAALGLEVAQGNLTDLSGALVERYRLPQPRIVAGRAAAGTVSAGIDISDGLVADIGHIAQASGVAAVIYADRVPLSGPAGALLDADPTLVETILTGGDDYELAFAVRPSRSDRFLSAMDGANCSVSAIGEVTDGTGVSVVDRLGAVIPLKYPGFMHR